MKSFDVDGLLSHLCGLLVGFCLEFLEVGRNAMEKTAGSDIRQTVFFPILVQGILGQLLMDVNRYISLSWHYH